MSTRVIAPDLHAFLRYLPSLPSPFLSGNVVRTRDTLVYNLMAYAAMHDMYLPDMTPRPVRATDLLALAKKWLAGDPEMEKFGRPHETFDRRC